MTTEEGKKRLSVLLVGGLPPPIGGCTVTFQSLVSELAERTDVRVSVVDTSSIGGLALARVLRATGPLYRVWKCAQDVDVVTLHVASLELAFWGPLILAIARVRGKPIVVRKFAGTDYATMRWPLSSLAHVAASRANLYLCETRRLVRLSKQRGLEQTQWLPTSRRHEQGSHPTPSDGRCRKFVYIGQVRQSKGILELAMAAEQLPEGMSVDVYGPVSWDIEPATLCNRRNLSYRGVVDPSRVQDVMRNYDAAVLPSKATTEGYPGMLLEALMAGLPVVASASGAISEIVDDDVGVLVPPGDVSGLLAAMRRLADDATTFHTMQRNASERGRYYSSERWSDQFVAYCRQVTETEDVRRV